MLKTPNARGLWTTRPATASTRTGFTTTVVRQGTNASDVAAVANLNHVERNDVANVVVGGLGGVIPLQPVRRVQTEFAEVANEHVN